MNEWEVKWSRDFFNSLAINAIWGVPRSGLVFKKITEVELALDNLMPWTSAMGMGFQWGFDVPPTKKELKRCQRADFMTIAKRFEAAGIKVTDPKGLVHD